MKKYLAFKSLNFQNGVSFTQRGKLYPESEYNTAKTLHNLQLQFCTKEGDMVTFSDDPDDDMYIDNVFQDYDKYKLENENGKRQGDKK